MGRVAPYSFCAPISFRKRRALCSHRWLGSCWPDAREVYRTSSIASGKRALPRRLHRDALLPADVPPSVPATVDLEFFNGLGGFAANGREYVTILGAGQVTPAPWINVISNASFGFQVAVEGGGYTWSVNSRENQLTPWSNDPVTDRPGEVIFLRDEDTGELWGPTALPIRDEAAPYIVRHGQGYSRFEHAAHGIELDLLQYVPLDDPIKISRLTIRNSVSADATAFGHRLC